LTTYVALLDGGKREVGVEVRMLGPGLYEVVIGGRARRVDAFRHDSGTVSLLVDTASYSVQLDERGTEVRVHLGDSVFPVDILDERRLRMRRGTGKVTVDGRQSLAARLPGRVARVLRKVGDDVREGEGVVVLEAMNMENEVKSPKSGRVVEVLVVEGQTVEGGAKLAAVE